MARYIIPKNLGKVRVVMGLGGTYVVWNGKTGRLEFRIVCRKRNQAYEIAEKINRGDHTGEIEVLS